MGPEAIRNGRPACDGAIPAASDEQWPHNTARLRFTDSLRLLAASSVAANVAPTTGATASAGLVSPGGWRCS